MLYCCIARCLLLRSEVSGYFWAGFTIYNIYTAIFFFEGRRKASADYCVPKYILKIYPIRIGSALPLGN